MTRHRIEVVVIETACHQAGMRLAQAASGRIDFKLADMTSDDPQLAALSEVSLLLDLPGVETPPDLQAAVVFNGETVELKATTDPLPQMIGGERFAADLSVASDSIVEAG